MSAMRREKCFRRDEIEWNSLRFSILARCGHNAHRAFRNCVHKTIMMKWVIFHPKRRKKRERSFHFQMKEQLGGWRRGSRHWGGFRVLDGNLLLCVIYVRSSIRSTSKHDITHPQAHPSRRNKSFRIKIQFRFGWVQKKREIYVHKWGLKICNVMMFLVKHSLLPLFHANSSARRADKKLLLALQLEYSWAKTQRKKFFLR